MASQIRTPDGIVVFDKYIFDPSIPDEDVNKPEEQQRKRYSIQLAFSPDTDLSKIEKVAEAAFLQQFPKDRFNDTANPLKSYSGKREELFGWTQINFNSIFPLKVYDRRGLPIEPGAGGIYSGCKAAVVCYPKTSGGTNGWAKRASFVCTGVQVIEQLDPHFQNQDPSDLIMNLDDEPGSGAFADGMAEDSIF